MSVPVDQTHLGAVIRPYFQTQPAALTVWLLINLVSFGFEFVQWQQRRADAQKSDRGSFAVLMACTVIGILWLGSAPKITPAATIRPPSAAFAVGLALFLAGFAMRRWSEATLGRYFTFRVMTSADQPVITSGPYRFVRHPGYTGVVLIVVGAGLVNDNWAGLLGWSLLVFLPLLYRIHVEERALLSAVGDRYRDYADHHKRLIPLIW